jgi:hypothetical protein
MAAVRSRATNVSQSPIVGEFENMLPLYFVNASGMTTISSRVPAAIARSIDSGMPSARTYASAVAA